jgi:subtilisin family serine protease
MKYSKIPFLFLACAAPFFAQVVPDRYIVELSGEPAAPYAAKRGHRAHTSDSVYAARVAEIRTQHNTARAAAEQQGAEILDSTEGVLNALMVRIPATQAASLASIPGVLHVYPVRLYQPVLDHALPIHSVPDAWNQIGGMGNAGAGIKIAIIDTGIDNTHPAFQDSSLTPPSGYPITGQASDKTYLSSKIIVVRTYGGTTRTPVLAHDDVGHGTGVAMTAAGVQNTGAFGTITGVAPKAFLGSYKVFPNTTGGAPNSYIIRALEDALADGMDVMNLSLGSPLASRLSDDPLVSAVENVTAAGRIVTIAAGNSGPDLNTMSSPGTAPDAITVGSMSNDRVFSGSITVNGSAPILALPGSGPNSTTPITAPIQDIAGIDPSGLACGTLKAGSLTGAIALIERGTCTFETKFNNAAAAGAVAALIYARPESPDAINMAAGAATLPAAMVSNADGNSIKQQIAAGSVTGTLDFSPKPVTVVSQRISGFSAKGPSVDTSIKPDLVAVGDPISTATPLLNDGSADDGYVVENGTSFSSPLVAGAAALLKGARPGLTVSQYRSLLINSASNFDTPPGIQQTGAGYLNMSAALQGTAVALPTSLSFGFGGGTVNQTSTLWLGNVGTSDDVFSISVSPLNGNAAPSLSSGTLAVPAGQWQSMNVQFNAGSLAAGTYEGWIQVQGSQSSVIANIPYWYAVSSGTAAHVTALDAPTSGTGLSQQTITVRTTDASGIPIATTPQVSITSGGGRLINVSSFDSSVPGAYQAIVRLGASGSTNVIHFQSGSASTDVTITAQ